MRWWRRATPTSASALPERLDAMRKEQQRNQQPPGYDRHCLTELTAEERNRRAAEGPHVVRYRIPTEGGTVIVNDFIRGDVAYDPALLDDMVIMKSDGFPTYHLANVVDDHYMRITHVMRAEEWLPSTPRHVLLYRSLGWTPPVFAHLPMILGPDRSKLSKRHGATSTLEYERDGYLPEALTNFMALLGWSLDDHTEVFSRDELVQHFDLERVGKSGAIFNADKLTWMNGLYIRQMLAPGASRPNHPVPGAARSRRADCRTTSSVPLDAGFVAIAGAPRAGAVETVGRGAGASVLLLCGAALTRDKGSRAQGRDAAAGRERAVDDHGAAGRRGFVDGRDS